MFFLSCDNLADLSLHHRTANITTPSNKRQPTTARDSIMASFPPPLLSSFLAPLVGPGFVVDCGAVVEGNGAVFVKVGVVTVIRGTV